MRWIVESPSLPPGKSPLPSRPRCFPRYHPSPKPSSSSTNSIRSPRLKVNSSALRASKSSANYQLLTRAERSRGKETHTDNNKDVTRSCTSRWPLLISKRHLERMSDGFDLSSRSRSNSKGCEVNCQATSLVAVIENSLGSR